MLVVDSNKRIKLHEIRQLPWFTKDLPSYLFAPTVAPSTADDDGDVQTVEAEESQQWNAEEERQGKSGRRREWVDGLGVVDQEIVEDLCGKIEGLTSEDVWSTLKTGGDKELRIAYQLCRDNKRMVEGCECPQTIIACSNTDRRYKQRTTTTPKRFKRSMHRQEFRIRVNLACVRRYPPRQSRRRR